MEVLCTCVAILRWKQKCNKLLTVLEWLVKVFNGDGDLPLLFAQAVATQDSPSFTRIFKLLIIKGRTYTFISSGNFHVYGSQRVVKSAERKMDIHLQLSKSMFFLCKFMNCMFRFCKWRGCGKEWWYAQLTPSIFSILVLCGGFLLTADHQGGVCLHLEKSSWGEP